MPRSKSLSGAEIGVIISKHLDAIESLLLDQAVMYPDKRIEYTEEGFRAAIYIFSNVMFSKMYGVRKEKNEPQEIISAEVEFFGKNLRNIILSATGLDTHDLWKGDRESPVNRPVKEFIAG
jgi:hypothetical protein